MNYDKKRNKVHCFSCGADYDTLDIIGIDHGLTDGRDIFNKAYEIFNLMVENDVATKLKMNKNCR
jgi:replicative DNA helicase